MIAQGKIGKIKIHYRDTKLIKICEGYRQGKNLTKHPRSLLPYRLKFVSLNNLKKGNIIAKFMPKENNIEEGKIKCSYGANNISGWGMNDASIIFSYDRESIITPAVSCFSLVLFCKAMKLGAGMHIDVGYTYHASVYVNMTRYAVANITKMAGKNKVVGYISGSHALNRLFDSNQIKNNREVLNAIIPELISRGVGIKLVDIGGNYKGQELFLKTGKYELVSGKDKREFYLNGHSNSEEVKEKVF